MSEVYVAEFVCEVDEGVEIDERDVLGAALDASACEGVLGVDVERPPIEAGRRLCLAVEFESERARRLFWESGAGGELVDALCETVPTGAVANRESTERSRARAD